MSALGNNFTNSYNQPSTNNCQEEAGLNGPLTRSPKFIAKDPSQTKNETMSTLVLPPVAENRPITTIPVFQK